MNYIFDKIKALGFSGRTGHPCAYDALDIAARLVQAESYLEIGVLDGGSLFSVLHSAPRLSRLVLCDIFADDWMKWGPGNNGAPAGSHAHIDKILADWPYLGQVEFLVGDSHELIPLLPRSVQFDLIFVDGGHSYEDAIRDFKNVWPLCRIGGLIVFDDSSRLVIQPICKLIREKYRMRELFVLDDGADTTTVFEKVIPDAA